MHSEDTMSMFDIHLRVPATRSACAAWILTQEPTVVADALTLCETALTAVRQNIFEEELEDVKKSHKETLCQLKQQAAHAATILERQHREALDALQQNADLNLRRNEETYNRKTTLLQQRIDELDASLTETRMSKQRHVDDATSAIKRRLDEDHERRESSLLAEIESLKRDVELRKGGEAQALLQEKRRTEDLLLQKDAEHQRVLQLLKEDRQKYENFLTSALEKKSSELVDALASKDAFSQRVETLVSEHRDLVARLGGATARGQMGERFVANIFSRLQLGDWQDDHGNKDEGFADALWTWQPSSNTPALSCLVEVKYVADIHTQHDIAKFHRDLQAAARNNRANAGLFISLAKHYPGKPSLQLTMEHGLPVCWASRNEDDPLPAACLVQLAFQAMASAWPLISRKRGEGIELTILAAAEQFEDQLSKCSSISKHIESITRAATTLLREAKSLEKIRDSMVKGIECVRMSHPSLVPEIPDLIAEEEEVSGREAHGDPWNSTGAQKLLEAIVKQKKGTRYPKESEVTLEHEAVVFVRATPNAFLIAIDRLKKEAGSKGRKRKAPDGTGAIAEGDE